MPISQGELAELYRQHLAMVQGTAMRILGDKAAAADVAQEVFLKYMQHRRGRPVSEVNTAAFLYTLVTRRALNALRGRGRRSKNESSAAQEGHHFLHMRDDSLDVRTVLARVPQDLAIIAAYYYIEGLEHEEIGTLLDMTRRTVGRRLEAFVTLARKIIDAQVAS